MWLPWTACGSLLFAIPHFTLAHRMPCLPRLCLPSPGSHPTSSSPWLSHDHRNGMPLRQCQTATRHVLRQWSRVARRKRAETARSRGAVFSGGNSILNLELFGGNRNQPPRAPSPRPIPQRPSVASTGLPPHLPSFLRVITPLAIESVRDAWSWSGFMAQMWQFDAVFG